MQHSNGYIIGFTVVMSLILAVLLASAATVLKPRQDKAKDLDAKKQILGAVMEVTPEMDAIDLYNKNIEAILVDINGNKQDTGEDPSKINVTKESKKDPAERKYPVFIYKKDGKVDAYIIPTLGKGLWNDVSSFIAVESDLNTIKGAVFGHVGETPGLGARITDKSVQQRYQGKKIYNEKGEIVSVEMVKGERGGGDKSIAAFQDNPHQVDGLSGATLTAIGVNDMLKNYFGFYHNYFSKLKKAEEKTEVVNTETTQAFDSLVNQIDSLGAGVDSLQTETDSVSNQ